MPEGLKGIQRDPNKLNNRLGTAAWYLGSRWDDLGGNTETLIKNTTKAVSETVEEVNQFLEKDFKEYEDMIDSLDFDLFKKIDDIKKQ